MDAAIVPAGPDRQSAGARHVRVICAILFAAARFVPLPFLDDVLRARVRQYLVHHLLLAAGRSYGSRRVPALWQDTEGCGGGCVALLWRLPLKLLLFPIRKLIAIVTAARDLSGDLTHALLYGRAVERVLAAGLLPDAADDAARDGQALRVRNAFEVAAKGASTEVIRAALAPALAGIAGLPRAALRAARALVRRQDAATPTAAASPRDARVVEQGAGAVEAALQQPGVQQALAEFDGRFDAALAATPTA